MCGIAGIYLQPNTDAVRNMAAAMHHRGPDDSGLYADDTVAIAQARLAIIDTTAGGHQPGAPLAPRGRDHGRGAHEDLWRRDPEAG